MVLTPMEAAIEADPLLCHVDATVTDHATLHLRAAAPAHVLVLTRAAAEPRIVLVAIIATALALTAPIPGARPGTGDEDTRALSAAHLLGNVITVGQGGPALAPPATAEQGVLTPAGLGAASPPHPSGDTTGAGRNLGNGLSGLVRQVNTISF